MSSAHTHPEKDEIEMKRWREIEGGGGGVVPGGAFWWSLITFLRILEKMLKQGR
jgi:hypothetical protein